MGSKARKRLDTRRITVAGDESLQLRDWTLADAEELIALVNANRPYLRQWMSWIDTTTTPAHTRAFIQTCLDGYEDGSNHRWAIALDGNIIGVTSLEDIVGVHRRAKIGYWLAEAYQGQGIITRAVRSVMQHGFTARKLHLLELRAAKENQKSRAVASRLGMNFDGVLRQQEWLYDRYVDHAAYSLTESEWDPL